eukprot:Em0007g701a
MNDSVGNVSSYYTVIGATNGVSVLVCILAAVLVFVLKLYNRLVYRLALYQVLSSLSLATGAILQITLVNHSRNPVVYGHLCTAVAWFTLYTEWMKLLFTVWVTFHLFCFAVLHRNLKKLEVFYVVTSLLVPAVVASVPLVTRSYAPSPDSTYACYIYAKTEVAFIESVVLWDGPALIVLLVASAAMILMVIKMACKVCWRSQYEPITDGDQFWLALKHLLPLAAFPILFFVFDIPLVMFHIYVAQGFKLNSSLDVSRFVFFSLWSMTSGTTLIIHILVVQMSGRKHKPKIQNNTTGNNSSIKLLTTHQTTYFSLPPASV